LRVVEVPDFDLSACGGTHVPRTGMVGMIAVSGWERFKGGTRVAFVCGGRALAAFGASRDVLAAVTRTLSIAPVDLPAAVERLQRESRESARTMRALREDLARFQAAGLRQAAETIGGRRVVLTAAPESDAGVLKSLAAAVVAEPGFIIVATGAGRPVPVVVARSSDVVFDASAWMAQAAKALGGRGGGRPELAQGGLQADAAGVLAYARETLQ
jgi:alanyl-tRNA synthetase